MGRRKKVTTIAPIPDMSPYPDLVVILLGMRVPSLPGIATLQSFQSSVDRLPARKPEGLLHVDTNIVFSLVPFHIGMRWYWRDPDCLSKWLRSDAHRRWWARFVEETRGTDIWHETYHPRSGPTAVSRGPGLPTALERPKVVRPDGRTVSRQHYDHAPSASVW